MVFMHPRDDGATTLRWRALDITTAEHLVTATRRTILRNTFKIGNGLQHRDMRAMLTCSPTTQEHTITQKGTAGLPTTYARDLLRPSPQDEQHKTNPGHNAERDTSPALHSGLDCVRVEETGSKARARPSCGQP